jgi:hypothetical protein
MKPNYPHNAKNFPRDLKIKARQFVNHALRTGYITRPETCEMCGVNHQDSPLQAHHTNYYETLNIIWLCVPCHNKQHQESKGLTEEEIHTIIRKVIDEKTLSVIKEVVTKHGYSEQVAINIFSLTGAN